MVRSSLASVCNILFISFHPCGGEASSRYFHDEPWLDFNMVQSGHGRNTANHRFMEEDYRRVPVKPCMDAEPGYEDHPAGFDVRVVFQSE